MGVSGRRRSCHAARHHSHHAPKSNASHSLACRQAVDGITSELLACCSAIYSALGAAPNAEPAAAALHRQLIAACRLSHMCLAVLQAVCPGPAAESMAATCAQLVLCSWQAMNRTDVTAAGRKLLALLLDAQASLIARVLDFADQPGFDLASFQQRALPEHLLLQQQTFPAHLLVWLVAAIGAVEQLSAPEHATGGLSDCFECMHGAG